MQLYSFINVDKGQIAWEWYQNKNNERDIFTIEFFRSYHSFSSSELLTHSGRVTNIIDSDNGFAPVRLEYY